MKIKTFLSNLNVILIIALFVGCSGREYDCVEYRAKNNSFTEVYKSNVYYNITFGNKVDKYAVVAVLADEDGNNVFGQIFGGTSGLNTIVEGNYKIEGNEIILNWLQTDILSSLPKRLKISSENFTSDRINTSVENLKDESNNLNYSLCKKWNVN